MQWTQPPHVQRAAIVRMVSMDFDRATYLARHSLEASIMNSARHDPINFCLYREFGTAFILPFENIGFPFWPLKSLPFILADARPIFRVFNIGLGTRFAFSQMTIRHCHVFIESRQRLTSSAFKADLRDGQNGICSSAPAPALMALRRFWLAVRYISSGSMIRSMEFHSRRWSST